MMDFQLKQFKNIQESNRSARPSEYSLRWARPMSFPLVMSSRWSVRPRFRVELNPGQFPFFYVKTNKIKKSNQSCKSRFRQLNNIKYTCPGYRINSFSMRRTWPHFSIAPENPFINAQFNFVICLFFIYLHKLKKILCLFMPKYCLQRQLALWNCCVAFWAAPCNRVNMIRWISN
jgi:hypothetical protein